MFPPKRTTSVTEWLENLLSTLARGGLEINKNIGLDEDDDGKYSVKIKLMSPIPKEGWEPFKLYANQYSQLSGWKIERVRQERGCLFFKASRA